MRGHKVGNDAITRLQKQVTINYLHAKPAIPSAGEFPKAFWVLCAIAVSFVLSQSVILFTTL